MATPNTRFVLDFVLVAASIWRVLTLRGPEGVVGRTLNLITLRAIITGLAHLLTTLQHRLMPWESSIESFAHRIVVLLAGFRQIRRLRI